MIDPQIAHEREQAWAEVQEYADMLDAFVTQMMPLFRTKVDAGIKTVPFILTTLQLAKILHVLTVCHGEIVLRKTTTVNYANERSRTHCGTSVASGRL